MARGRCQTMICKPGSFEFGWVIGFLEGEGTFYSTRKPGSGVRITVRAYQVQREPLERLLRYTGIGSISKPHQPKDNPKASPISGWSLHEGKTCILFLETIIAFMSPRRQMQIAAVLSRYEARPRRDGLAAVNKSWATRRARGWTHPGFKGRFGSKMQLIKAEGA